MIFLTDRSVQTREVMGLFEQLIPCINQVQASLITTSFLSQRYINSLIISQFDNYYLEMEENQRKPDKAYQQYLKIVSKIQSVDMDDQDTNEDIEQSFRLLMKPQDNLKKLEGFYSGNLLPKHQQRTKVYSALIRTKLYDEVKLKILRGWLYNTILENIKYKRQYAKGLSCDLIEPFETLAYRGTLEQYLRNNVQAILKKSGQPADELEVENIIQHIQDQNKSYELLKDTIASARLAPDAYSSNKSSPQKSEKYDRSAQSIKNRQKYDQSLEKSRINRSQHILSQKDNESYGEEDLRILRQNQQFKEQYSNLKQDLSRYPEGSFEKVVQEGALLAFELIYQIKQDKFDPIISNIQEAYKKEERYITQNKAEIEQQITVIARQQNKQERYAQLIRLKKLLLIIDVFQLERLLKKTVQSKQTIKNRDIILVVGTTGSGKTTNIWRLLGYQLKPVQFHGFNIYATTQQLAPNHKSFMASPESKSCTRYINAAEIPDDMHEDIELGDFQKNLYICDSPGFGDTGGCQIDISNQIGMINALSQCKSVRILLILARDALTGERMKGARDIGQIMSTLCPKQAIGTSLHIFFNKLQSKEQIPTIKYGIENVIIAKQELNLSNKVVTFMKRMKNMAQSPDNYLFPLDESKKVWQQRLYKLFQMRPIDKSQISNEFQYTYSQRSKAAITIFLKQRTQRIRKYLDRQEYERISYEYQITSLFVKQFQNTQQEPEYSILIQDSQSTPYQKQSPYRQYLFEIEKKISQKILEIFNQVQDKLKQIVNKKDNAVYFEEIKVLKEKLIRCQKLFSKNIKGIKTEKDLDSLVLNFWGKITKSLENLESKNIVKKAQIMVSFSCYFKLEKQLKQVQRMKQKEFEDLQQLTMPNLKAYDKTINDNINNLITLESVLKTIAKDHWSQKRVNHIKSAINQDLSQAKQKVEVNIERRLSEDSVQKIREYLEKSEKIQKLTIFSGQNEMIIQRQGVINILENSCAQKIRNMTKQPLGEEYEEITAKHLSSMKDLRKDLELLLKLDFLKDKFMNSYEDAKQRLRKNFNSSFENFNAQIKYNNSEDCEISKYQKNFQEIIKNTIQIIRYSSLINQIEETNQKSTELEESIRNVIEKQEELVRELDLGKNGYQHNMYTKIKPLLTKIQTHSMVFKRHGRHYPQLFNSLNSRNQEIRVLLEEQIKRPISQFKDRLKEELQSSKKSNFIIRSYAEEIQNCLSFINTIATQFNKKSQFYKTRQQFQSVINDVFKQLSLNCCSFHELQSITDVINPKYEFLKEMFITFDFIKGKHEIGNCIGLNIQGLIDQASRMFKQWYSQVENRISNGSIDYNSKQIQNLFDSINKIKTYEQILFSQSTFKDLYQQILKGRVKNINSLQQRALDLINRGDSYQQIFQELPHIIKETEQTSKEEKKTLIKNIVKALQGKQREIVRKIREIEKQYSQKSQKIGYLLKNQQSLKDSQPMYKQYIVQYLDWCTKAKDFRLKGRDFEDSLKQKSEGLDNQNIKQNVFVSEISDKYLIDRLNKINQNLSKECQVFIKAMKSYDLKKMVTTYELIRKLQLWAIQVKQKVFYQNKDWNDPKTAQPVGYKLQSSKECQLKNFINKQPILKELRQESQSQLYKRCEKCIDCYYHHAEKNYLCDARELKFDDKFKAYYQTSQANVREVLEKRIQSLYKEKISMSKSIYKPDDQQMNRFPEKIKESIRTLISQAASKFQCGKKTTIQSLITKMKRDSSYIPQFISLAKQLSNSSDTQLKQIYNFSVQAFQKLYDEKVRTKSQKQLLSLFDSFFWSLFQKDLMKDCPKQLSLTIVSKYNRLLQNCNQRIKEKLYKIQSQLSKKNAKGNTKESINLVQSLYQLLNKVFSRVVNMPQSIMTIQRNVLFLFQSKMKQILQRYDINRRSLGSTTFFSTPNDILQKNLSSIKQNSQILSALKKGYKDMVKKKNLNITIPIQQSCPQDLIKGYKQSVGKAAKKLKDFTLGQEFFRNQTLERIKEQLKQIDQVYKDLNQKDSIISKYIYENPRSKDYNLPQLKKSISESIKQLSRNAKTEVTQIFQSNNQKEYKLANYFKSFWEIVKSNKMDLFPRNIIQTQSSYIKQSLSGKLREFKNSLIKELEQVCYEAQNNEYNFKEQIQNSNTQIEQKNRRKEQEKQQLRQKHQKQIQKIKQNTYDKQELNNKINAKEGQMSTTEKLIDDKYSIEINQLQRKNICKQEFKGRQIEKKCLNIAEKLIICKKVSTEIRYVDEIQEKFFYNVISGIKNKGEQLVDIISKCLATALVNNKYANLILKSENIFMAYQDYLRQQLVKAQDINYVIRQLRQQQYTQNRYQVVRTSPKLQGQIKTKFQDFNSHYGSLTKKYLAEPSQATLDGFKNKAKALGMELSKVYQQGQKKTGDKQILLAYIFAILSISKSSFNRNFQKASKNIKILFKPHQIQVVSLLLMLGVVGDKQQQLENRMAEVGTGQGKSIIFAVMSIYLALVGFNVRCACYSQYLSKRDEGDFKQLFVYMDVDQKIKYGTFNKICEETLNRGNRTFTQEVSQMITNRGSFLNKFVNIFGFNINTLNRGKNNVTDFKTVLLVDEADVFFDRKYYGSCYCPAIKLRDKYIVQLLKFIWKMVQGEKQVNQSQVKRVEESKEFKKVVQIYPNLQTLLKNQINGMIIGAFQYRHHYEIVQQRLVYKDNDSINYRLSYGYKTVFANIFENQRNNVSQSNLTDALAIELIVAEFSYAQLPHLFHKKIGITGTLRAMPSIHKKILTEEYKFAESYIVPSSFGLNEKKKFCYFVVGENELYQKIIDRIAQVDAQRPILVFFNSSIQLYEFYNYCKGKQLRKRIQNLTQNYHASDRDNIIFNSTSKEKITLMTKAFGRGTDFQVFDKEVNKNGGVHVMQVFLSIEESQEVQIKGRTFRQNSNGSCDIFIKSSELQLLDIKQNLSTKKSQQIYSALAAARQRLAINIGSQIAKQVKFANERHNNVSKIFGKKDLSQKDFLNYIQKINEHPILKNNKIRTILAIDGTGSMGSTLRKVMGILRETLKRTYKIIQEENSSSLVELKIMIYRNYSSHPNDLLSCTAFESRPENLNTFMTSACPLDGWGNEAIQVALQAINREEEPISQVILIGDAGYNTAKDVTQKRAFRGQDFWVQNGFPPTNALTELEKIRGKNIPIHSFYLGSAKNDFELISKQTRGTSQPFPQGNEQFCASFMSNFMSRTILGIAQQQERKRGKLVDLIKLYDKYYPERYEQRRYT